jgi:hypothetical protein
MAAALAGLALILQAASTPATPPPAPPAPTKLAYIGPPRPDPRVVSVGDCVWNAVAGQAGATTPEAFIPNSYNTISWRGPHPGTDHALWEAQKTCDPDVRAHRRYSTMSVVASAEMRAALARLRPEGIDQARLEKAWAAAPAELRQSVRTGVEQWLDGTGGDVGGDWMPLFRTLGQRRAPESPRGLPSPAFAEITPAQASIRDYVFGRELLALIREHMTRVPDAAEAKLLPSGTWPLDSPWQAELMGEYYPPAAAEAGKSGRATIECHVTQWGGLADCAVLAETPGGMGFGAATIQVFTHMVLLRMDGSAPDLVPGKAVVLAIHWSLPTE